MNVDSYQNKEGSRNLGKGKNIKAKAEASTFSMNKVNSSIHKHNGTSQQHQLYITICPNHVTRGFIKAMFGLCKFQMYVLILC